jgi:acyl-CoA thioesterase-1
MCLVLTTSIQAYPDKRTAQIDAPQILIVGDSLSAGYGMKTEESWVALLRQRLKEKSFSYQIINASISGNTTGNGLLQLKSLLKKYQPEIVLIELGGNDGLRGLSLTSIKDNLRKMIELAQSNNARVILAGIRLPPNYGLKYTQAFYEIFLQLAKHSQVDLIPFFLEGVGDNRNLMQADGIHPTAQAQPIILDVTWPYIEALLNKKETSSSPQPSTLSSTE